jgi:hypothetical protein
MIAVILRIDYELKQQRIKVGDSGVFLISDSIGASYLMRQIEDATDEEAKQQQDNQKSKTKTVVKKRKKVTKAADESIQDISEYVEEAEQGTRPVTELKAPTEKVLNKTNQPQSKIFDQANAKKRINRESI